MVGPAVETVVSLVEYTRDDDAELVTEVLAIPEYVLDDPVSEAEYVLEAKVLLSVLNETL